MSRHAQNLGPGTSKWSADFIHIISYTCDFTAVSKTEVSKKSKI